MAYVYRIGREDAKKSIAKYAYHLRGKCLDVGTQGPKSRYVDLLKHVESYTSLDIDPKHKSDIVSDAEAMTVADESFDSILCTQVLYAIPHPPKAVAEFHRVLKKGGVVLMTVPFTNLWIGEHDYWRFSPTGVTLLLEEAGFEIIAMEKTGVGIFTLGSQLFSKFLKSALDLNNKGLLRIICNRIFMLSARIARSFDALFASDTNDQFFLDVTIVARKI